MKRIAIAELEGVALDWAVAMAAGVDVSLTMAFPSAGVAGLVPWDDDSRKRYRPTMDWRQCGPLIERYISALNQSGYGWWAHSGNHIGEATSPLVAACRAIVAAHNPSGFVEVPDELVEGE